MILEIEDLLDNTTIGQLSEFDLATIIDSGFL
jgi:hypothetical protein